MDLLILFLAFVSISAFLSTYAPQRKGKASYERTVRDTSFNRDQANHSNA